MTAVETVLTSGMSPLSIQLKKARTGKGLTQAELAALVDVRRATISDIERGSTRPTLDGLERIAAALGVRALDLLVETPAKRKPRRK